MYYVVFDDDRKSVVCTEKTDRRRSGRCYCGGIEMSMMTCPAHGAHYDSDEHLEGCPLCLENYESSVHKWEVRTYDWMMHQPKHGGISRAGLWKAYCWRECGFCRQFEDCSDCPLSPSHCYTSYYESHTLQRMYEAWRNADPLAYAAARYELLTAIKAIRSRFEGLVE